MTGKFGKDQAKVQQKQQSKNKKQAQKVKEVMRWLSWTK